MWSMSTVVQVDSDKVIVTQFERRKNRSALPRFIFHSAFTHNRGLSSKKNGKKQQQKKLNSDLNRIPFSLFIQVVSEFCSWRNPIFSSAISSLQNAHWHESKSVPFLKNNLNSSSKLFILLFIPPRHIHASLSFLPEFTGHQSLHRASVSPLH